MRWFKKSLAADFSNSPHEKWRRIDMGGHFYMISVDIRGKKVNIIDNSSAPITKQQKYG
nr:uncharacterized protein LOC109159949 [Ipomoea batatas]